MPIASLYPAHYALGLIKPGSKLKRIGCEYATPIDNGDV